MNFVTRALIAEVEWAHLRSGTGNGADLPQALADLWAATSASEAGDAYWRIDNVAIVQGELYEAALPTLEVLLSMAATIPPGPARASVAELIQQIIFGEPRSSEIALGNTDLAIKCRALASGAIWIFYAWLSDSDSDVRECALLALQKLENDEKRKASVFAACRSSDVSPGVQNIFSEIDRGLL